MGWFKSERSDQFVYVIQVQILNCPAVRVWLVAVPIYAPAATCVVDSSDAVSVLRHGVLFR